MIKYLSQWIKHNVAIMSDRSFPNNPAELKVLMIYPSDLIILVIASLADKPYLPSCFAKRLYYSVYVGK